MNPADIAASGFASPTMEVFFSRACCSSAHFVVKLVMLGLLGARFGAGPWSSTKCCYFPKPSTAMAQFEEIFWSGASLDELYATLSSRPRLAWRPCSSRRCGNGGVRCKARPGRPWACRRRQSPTFRSPAKLKSSNPAFWCRQPSSARPSSACSALSGASSTAFRSIAASRGMLPLAVVAPGIAEALFATAIGLFAAIPALIAYNKFQGDVARRARLEGFADEFSEILSRQIDQHSVKDRAA